MKQVRAVSRLHNAPILRTKYKRKVGRQKASSLFVIQTPLVDPITEADEIVKDLLK
jgi:hypothetical protein